MDMRKKTEPRDGIVYSTDPSFSLPQGFSQDSQSQAPGQQKLIVRLDTRNRGGKAVTLVEGFAGNKSDLEQLGRSLKTLCGTGGSAKDGVVIIQGDQRQKIAAWLSAHEYGYSVRK